jgi:hypothetical protein
VALPNRLNELLDGLQRDWSVARVDLTVDGEHADRTALVLAPAGPGRSGTAFRLIVTPSPGGAGATPGVARRVLARLDELGIRARLALASFEAVEAAPARQAEEPHGLAAQWDDLVAKLPADWSDLLVELELDSSDFLERGALLLAPVNPATFGVEQGFRFRSAQRFGYGAAPQMARRSLERLDEEGVTGRLRTLRVLSDTKPVATQGPVWRLGGRAV